MLNSTNTHYEAHIASILGAPPTKLRLKKVNKDMEPFMMFTPLPGGPLLLTGQGLYR